MQNTHICLGIFKLDGKPFGGMVLRKLREEVGWLHRKPSSEAQGADVLLQRFCGKQNELADLNQHF